jgi:PST family polysaccharide transporter
MALRIISWPMGFIVLAKGAQKAFFWTELAWTAVHVLLAWVCVGLFGLRGAGMAFFGSYIFHVVMIYIVVRRLSGFRWSMSNLKIAGLVLPLIGIVFCAFYILPRFAAAALGTVAVAVLAVFCLRSIVRLVPFDRIPSSVRQLLSWCRLAP